MKLFFLSTLAALTILSIIAQATKPTPDPDKTHLTWTSDDNPFRRAQLAPFNASHPTLDVQLDPNNADIEKVIVQSLAGVGPDLFDCYSGFQLAAYVKAGIAWDVTDELKKNDIDINQTWPAVRQCAVFDGRDYGFPVNAAVNGMWFHKDLLDEAGVEIPEGPWTWQQALPMLQKLVKTNARGKTIQYGLVMDWDNNYLQLVNQWGGHMYSPDGTRCTLDSPEAIAAVQFMQDLVIKYGVAPDSAEEQAMSAAGGWGGASVITLFGAKRGARALGGRWWLCALREHQYANLRLGVAEAPYGLIHTFIGYGKATLINRNSPHRQQALEFLKYLDSPEYNRLINHQADGCSAVMKYTYEPQFLYDPAYPEETSNAIWRSLLQSAQPEGVSPFMNGAVLTWLMHNQLDLIKGGTVSAAQGMREATRRINQRIQDNLRSSPALKAEYDRRIQAAQANERK